METKVCSTETCRILVIEDDDIDRLAIKRALKHQRIKYEIVFCYLVSETQGLVGTQVFDVILTDMSLPDSQNMETIRSIVHLFPKTPIVVLSGTDNDDIALEAVHCGAQDYLPKKYLKDADLISRTIQHAMERFQLKLGLEKIRERELFFAHYDQCTLLPNRVLFFDRLTQQISHAKRVHETFSLLFIDLDKFKQVNDSFGHGAGDKVLQTVAKRLSALLDEGDTVARFGGDEFIVLLPKRVSELSITAFCHLLIEKINEPVLVDGHHCTVGASIGVADYPRHGELGEELIKSADLAMYYAKQRGRNQVQFFNFDLYIKDHGLNEIESALKNELRNNSNNFKLDFQTKVNLGTDEIVAVESFFRWHHHELGTVYSDRFMPLTERMSLMRLVDTWFLESSCKALKQWKKQHQDVKLVINLSAASLTDINFTEGILKR